jgi:hypothetical protein
LTVELLRKREGFNSVRFITDNSGFKEDSEGRFFNMGNGEEVLRYIRGLGLNRIPVLVYTRNIDRTRFVEQFPQAGSTVRGTIVYKFIEGLAKRRDNIVEWAKFMAA